MSKQLTNDGLVDRVLELETKIKKCYDCYQEISDDLAFDYFEMLQSLTKEQCAELNQKSKLK